MKLVRGHVPDIITKKTGTPPKTSVADPALFKRLLDAKLLEEISEYMVEPRDPKELVDVLEVVLTMAHEHGIQPNELMQMRLEKLKERGAFTDKIVLHDP